MTNYLLESTIVFAVFFLYYHFLLKHETCHQFKRFYLILTSFLALILPSLHFQFSESTQLYSVILNEISAGKAIPNSAISPSFWQLIVVVYLLVSALLFVRLIREIVMVNNAINTAIIVDQDGYKLVPVKGELAPSSFMNYIFWDESKKLSIHEEQIILQHELVHVRGKHTFDLLYFELLKILFWFNPMVHYYKSASALNLEYLADQHSAPDNHQLYNSMLALNAIESKGLSMENYFNKSFTLKRIKMLNKKNRKTHSYKMYATLPVALVLFMIISCETTPEEINEIKMLNEEVFLVADVIPEPEGGIQGLYSYVASHLLYPTKAREAGIEGKVYVQFTVTKEGKVTDVSVTEGIGAGCDEESVRVIESFQNWKPGKKDGKNVNVQMTLPISFHLDV